MQSRGQPSPIVTQRAVRQLLDLPELAVMNGLMAARHRRCFEGCDCCNRECFMTTKISVAAAIAVMMGATSVEAQILPRTDGGTRGDRSTGRVTTVGEAIEAARRRAGVYGDGSTSRDARDARVPKGHLPPRGMCRVWIDGVPPGHQPAPTSCAQAERDRFQYSNARVIYGDRESFPGKGKGKWKNVDSRSDDRVWDDDEDSDRRGGKGKSKIAKARGKKSGRG